MNSQDSRCVVCARSAGALAEPHPTIDLLERIKNADIDGFLDLVRGGHLSNRQKVTALLASIKYRKILCYKLLIAHGVNPCGYNHDGLTALHFIFYKFYSEEYLYEVLDTAQLKCSKEEFNAFVNRVSLYRDMSQHRGMAALHMAIMKRQRTAMRKLIEVGADVNVISRGGNFITPLMKAAEMHDDRSVDILLKAGADVNLTDNKGRNALRYAIDCKCDICIIKNMVHHGADLNATCRIGHKTPLMAALSPNAAPMIAEFLVIKGADCDRWGGDGKSTIYLAVESKRIDAAVFVVSRLKNMQLLAGSDHSLLKACENGLEAVAELLVDYGWNLRIRDRMGYTCVRWAAVSKKEWMLNYILRVCDMQGLRQMILDDGLHAFQVAIDLGFEGGVKALLKYNVDPVRIFLDHRRKSQTFVLMTLVYRMMYPLYQEDLQECCQILKHIMRHGCRMDVRNPQDGYTVSETSLIGRMPEVAHVFWLAGSATCPAAWTVEASLPLDNHLVTQMQAYSEFADHGKERTAKTLQFIEHHVFQPRSLASLCRISVRQNLAVPCEETIKVLGLPEQLQAFLNLEEMDDLLSEYVNNSFDLFDIETAPERTRHRVMYDSDMEIQGDSPASPPESDLDLFDP